MQSPSLFRNILPVLGLVFALSPLGQAASPNRIAAVAAESRAAVPHTVSPRVKNAADLGSAPSDRVLDSLTLRFNMTAAQQATLTQLLNDQQNPSSPRYHQWLTPEQFGAQFGLSSADLAKVSSWLTSQGFTITGVARSSTFITFTGTVDQAQKAFHTTIHNLNLNGEQHFANTTDAVLPASIAGVVSTITGLNNFRLKSRAVPRVVKTDVLDPKYTSSVSGGHFIAPGDFYTIYDSKALISSGIDGTGVGAGTGGGYSIAVMGQVDLSLADVAAFRAASGLPANVPTVKTYGPDPGAATTSTSTPNTGDLAEAQLDVEWSGASAPSAKIVYVNSKDVINTSMPAAIDNNLAPIISISYGNCEAAAGISDMDSFNQLFQQANAEGITIVGPAGDSGATDCDSNTAIATQGLGVDFPGSSPFVTSAGGTMFNDGSSTGATTYWSATNGANSSSAVSYIPETAWNETSASGLSAGGGGASAFFSKPSWQSGTGVPNDYARDVPDISLDSASNHDGYLFCAQGSCVNGYRDASGNLNVVGGTSVVAPSFAGILALVEQEQQKLSPNISPRIGNANPTLYGLGLGNSSYYNDVFHDITGGNNSSPCETGTPNCPSTGSIGYTAGTGYDQATGLGTIDAYNLATKWSLSTPTGVNSAATISATSLTTTASICGISSGSLPLSVNVINGTFDSSGNPITGSFPTGTVQFFVDSAAVGSPVALVSGHAAYTLNTSAISSGAHTISAVYSGDNTYAGSRGTLLASDGSPSPIDVVSTTSPDFSITPCNANVTVKAGGVGPGIVFTLTPFQGFTGPITLTTNTNQTVAASYSFSPALSSTNTITINSTASVPVTLTLSAFQSNAKTATAQLKLASNHPPAMKLPWYVAGSGATLACMFLLVLPRRRRWGALLAVIISVGIIGAGGCGGSSSSTPTSTTTPTPTPVTNATPGTYTITITAVAGNVSHSATILFTVQ
ncbi:protease pro-enzyme activation domain-containing protein [Edaphobacter paludis]|uniref:Protease pro-enzyme activation domain-containing protein n=1 Tax=Edaphobacter paludis TaxID=3035702 RepID=A0AAU7D2K4_9BACT